MHFHFLLLHSSDYNRTENVFKEMGKAYSCGYKYFYNSGAFAEDLWKNPLKGMKYRNL